MDLNPAQIEIPEGSVVLREVRVVEYRNENGSTGIGIGVEDEDNYSVVRALGLLSIGSSLLARELES